MKPPKYVCWTPALNAHRNDHNLEPAHSPLPHNAFTYNPASVDGPPPVSELALYRAFQCNPDAGVIVHDTAHGPDDPVLPEIHDIHITASRNRVTMPIEKYPVPDTDIDPLSVFQPLPARPDSITVNVEIHWPDGELQTLPLYTDLAFVADTDPYDMGADADENPALWPILLTPDTDLTPQALCDLLRMVFRTPVGEQYPHRHDIHSRQIAEQCRIIAERAILGDIQASVNAITRVLDRADALCALVPEHHTATIRCRPEQRPDIHVAR